MLESVHVMLLNSGLSARLLSSQGQYNSTTHLRVCLGLGGCTANGGHNSIDLLNA